MSASPPSADGRSAGSWLSRRGPFVLAVSACVLVAALLRPFPAEFKFRHGGDCVHYYDWSKAIKERGLAAFPSLVEEWRTRLVGSPPPTRWAYLVLGAAAMKLWPNPTDQYDPLVLLAWLSGVLALIPMAFWLRRRAPPEIVILCLLFMATAPVSRALSHFPLSDTVGFLFGLVLFAVTAEWLHQPQPAYLAAITFTAFLSLTIREPGIVLILGASGLVFLDGIRNRRLRWAPLWALFGGCVLALVVTAFVIGGPSVLLGIMKLQGQQITKGVPNPYVTGPYYKYLVDLVLVSPALVMTVAVAVVPLWRREELRPLIEHVLTASLVTLFFFCFLPIELRYIMPVDAGLRLVAAAAVWALWTRRDKLPGGPLAAGVLLAVLFGHDLLIYRQLWGKDQIYDPVTWNLARQLRMIP